MSATCGALRITVLGCGSSAGVPRLGGDWGACDPDEPRNARTRCGLLIERKADADAPWREDATTTVLIDTSPDLRAQLLAAGVGRVDAVLYTHDHADQTHGIDDLRVLAGRMGRQVPVYMDAPTAQTLMNRFAYCFRQPPGGIYPPILDARVELEALRQTVIEGPGGPIAFTALDQEHGPVRSLGFRFGPAAYSNDVSDLPDESLARLKGLDLWIVDVLRYKPHISHAHLDKTLGWVAALKPARAVLTNLHNDLDYATLAAETPEHVTPAHDGLSLEVLEQARLEA